MEYRVIAMSLNRFDELISFWKSVEGLYVSDDDSYENLKLFLKRNPKLNFVVLHGNSIIAAIKCSHDGRRGYIHHLAVKEEFRKKGIARELIARCLNNLREEGIREFRVFVMDSTQEAIRFWKHVGFEEQVYDYRTLQMNKTVFNE